MRLRSLATAMLALLLGCGGSSSDSSSGDTGSGDSSGASGSTTSSTGGGTSSSTGTATAGSDSTGAADTDSGSGTDAGSTGDIDSSGGASTGGVCQVELGSEMCSMCLQEACCMPAEACAADPDCACLFACVHEMPGVDLGTCLESCNVMVPPNSYGPVAACRQGSCTDPCSGG